MSPHTRLLYTLIAALAMWLPACMSVLTGRLEYWTGGLVFLGAVAFAHVGTGLISGLLNSYQHTQDMVAQAQRQIEIIEERKAEEEALNRRAEDEQTP